MIKAKVLLHSINPYNAEQVVTMLIQGPTMMDAEFEKHGNIASNASSARAIGFPVTKLQEHAYIPQEMYQPANSMHSNERLTPEVDEDLQKTLNELYEHTVAKLMPFKEIVHKQHLNRYVTPYAMQTKVITANDFAMNNFFNLRVSEFADPNIRQLATKMQEAYQESTTELREYHIPMVSDGEIKKYDTLDLADISAGRIARVSYKTHDVIESADSAMKRAKMLINLGHWSCLEHQLFADLVNYPTTVTHTDTHGHKWSGRARGWGQYRKLHSPGLT